MTKKNYVRGQVILSVPHYDKGDGNTTTNINEAKRFTQKQCHEWYWDMRKNSPNGTWGYWPL